MAQKQRWLLDRQFCRLFKFVLPVLLSSCQARAAAPGVVHGWGNYLSGGQPAGMADVIDCKAASQYSYALRSDGTVAIWGNPGNGQGAVPAGLSNVVAIAAGYYMGMALTGDGQVQVWGAWGHVSQYDIVHPPSSGTNVIAIAGGMAHCLALRSNGTVVAWGDNTFQQISVPPTLSNVVAIAAGQAYSLAATADGNVVAWGNTGYYGGIPASATNVTMMAASIYGHALALRRDGRVVAWGNNSQQQATVPPGLSNVVAIAAGDQHSLALKADGTIVTWGLNDSGQCTVPANIFQSRAIGAGTSHNVLLSSAPLVDQVSPNISVPAGTNVVLQSLVACPAAWVGSWQKDGVLLGATNGLLTFTNVQSPSAGVYTFTASNAFGISTGSSITLQVLNSKPRWVSQPGNQATPLGESAQFSAQALGSEPLGYQWRHNGSPLPGPNGSVLVVSPVAIADEGAYIVTVTNAYGSITSAPAYLSATVPLLLQQPNHLRARTNWTVAIEAQVLSASAVTYRWLKNGLEFTNQAGPALSFSPLQAGDAGDYVLEASNNLGATFSRTAQVTVLPSQPIWPEPGVLVDFGNSPSTDATNFVGIAAGTWHTLGLRPNGTPRIWADPANLSLSIIPPEATNLVDVFAGPSYNLVIRQDGAAVGWGGAPLITSSGLNILLVTNVIAAGCGSSAALVARVDGSVAIFPTVYHVPTNVTNILQVAVTDMMCYGLRADGKLLAWSSQYTDPAGSPAAIVAGPEDIVALSQTAYPLALRKDGTVLASSGSMVTPTWNQVQGLSNVVEVAGGRGYVALLDTGEVRVWGDSQMPAAPPGLRAEHISAGLLRVVALTTAPFFDTQPLTQTNYSGATVVLPTVVRSPSAFTLQWYFNDAPLPGATNAVLTLPNVRPSQSGQYKLLAQSARYETYSKAATLTVQGTAEIITMPPDQHLPAGDTLALQVQFAAFPPASVQWRFNGITIPNGTNASLRLTSVTEAMSGYYTVTLSNLFGIVNSPATRVTVTSSPPVIVTQPVSPGPLPDGARLDLQVQAVGSMPLTYQWFFNSAPMAGKTEAILRLDGLGAEQNGNYQVGITNQYGAAVSTQVFVATFRTPPSPILSPSNLLVREGRPFALQAAPRGSPGASIQWRFEGIDLAGQTNLILQIAAAAPTNAGHYTLFASNSYGAAESQPTQIHVLRSPGPGLIKAWGLVTGAPTDVLADSVDAGYRHGLALLPDGTVTAWGDNSYSQTVVPAGLSNVVDISAGQNFSLALKSDGTVIGWGQNNAGQATPPANLSDVIALAAGASHAVALKEDGSVVTWGASNYTRLPAGLPHAAAIAAGPTYSLAVLLDGSVRGWGTPPLTQLTNVPATVSNICSVVAGQSTASGLDRSGLIKTWGSIVTIPSDATNLLAIAGGNGHALGLRADAKISAWGDDSYGQTHGARGTSNVVLIAAGDYTTLALSGEPRILNSPLSQTIAGGTRLALSVGALGTPPLAYRWYHTNTPIAGATNVDLVLNNFQAADAGNYSVEVSNAYLSVQTSFALNLGLPPAITTQPTNLVVTLGSNAVFSVQCTGTPTLQYQWSINGANLWRATNASLVMTNVLLQDAGRVAVLVSNRFGAALSAEALLQVVPPPARLAFTVTDKQLRLKLDLLQPHWPYALMVSTNLQDWSLLQTITTPGASYELVVPMSDNPGRFYRLKNAYP